MQLLGVERAEPLSNGARSQRENSKPFTSPLADLHLPSTQDTPLMCTRWPELTPAGCALWSPRRLATRTWQACSRQTQLFPDFLHSYHLSCPEQLLFFGTYRNLPVMLPVSRRLPHVAGRSHTVPSLSQNKSSTNRTFSCCSLQKLTEDSPSGKPYQCRKDQTPQPPFLTVTGRCLEEGRLPPPPSDPETLIPPRSGPLNPTPEYQSGSTLLLIPRRRQIPKRKFKGCFMGMGEDGRVGLPRNLLHERLRWLLPPPNNWVEGRGRLLPEAPC
ncbi:hypothetical protein U0070_007615 [Myodes glareolus]|uniref:Uncharacterized protein n=1 Tax=Myodes glareolus TaxID=447135 RepID=A0AAW0J037_MYOGA